jgi:hypothetical protein
MPHDDLHTFQPGSHMPQASTFIHFHDSEMHLQAPSRSLSYGRQLQAIPYPGGEATCTCVPHGQWRCFHSIASHYLMHDCASTCCQVAKL